MNAHATLDRDPLVVEDLSLAFGGIQVLQHIGLRPEAGEITGLIGPNGAGKTSFFNCLTGLYSPQQGSIRLGARRLDVLLKVGLPRSLPRPSDP